MCYGKNVSILKARKLICGIVCYVICFFCVGEQQVSGGTKVLLEGQKYSLSCCCCLHGWEISLTPYRYTLMYCSMCIILQLNYYLQKNQKYHSLNMKQLPLTSKLYCGSSGPKMLHIKKILSHYQYLIFVWNFYIMQ